MKHIILLFVCLFGVVSFSSHANNEANARALAKKNSCPISDAETLMCEALMCNPIGLVIKESRSKCLKINRKVAIYKAKLGFFKKPPKCKKRDKNCNIIGNATKGTAPSQPSPNPPPREDNVR